SSPTPINATLTSKLPIGGFLSAVDVLGIAFAGMAEPYGNLGEYAGTVTAPVTVGTGIPANLGNPTYTYKSVPVQNFRLGDIIPESAWGVGIPSVPNQAIQG